jgi:hypothetical protein
VATSKYRLTRGTHTVVVKGHPTTYRANTPGEDILSLSDEDAKKPFLKGRLQKVSGGAGKTAVEDDDEGQDTDSGDDWTSALSALTAPDAVKAIQQLETVEDATAAKEAEKAGKNRSTVVEAADAKLKELRGR